MEAPNHYELLCVTPEATAEDIRAAYRRLIRVYHPDVASPAGAAMTLRLNEAQRELLDPERRARYDGALRRGTPQRAPQRSERMPEPAFRPEQTFRPERPGTGQRNDARSARRPAASWNPALYGLWLGTMVASIVVAIAVTAIVFVYCYTGPMTLLTPRIVPPIVVGIAWLVGGFRRPSKLLIALLVIGAALWPLTAANVGPFTLLDSLPAAILPALTIMACAVVALRTSAPRVGELSRGRPTRRASAA